MMLNQEFWLGSEVPSRLPSSSSKRHRIQRLPRHRNRTCAGGDAASESGRRRLSPKTAGNKPGFLPGGRVPDQAVFRRQKVIKAQRRLRKWWC